MVKKNFCKQNFVWKKIHYIIDLKYVQQPTATIIKNLNKYYAPK